MIRSLPKFLMVACLLYTGWAFGQPVPSEVESRRQKLADLMARVSIHEAQVTSLLSKNPVPRTNFDLPPPAPRVLPPPAPSAPLPEAPYVPAPEFDNEPVVDETVKEVPAPPSLDDLVADPNQVAASGSDGNTSVEGEEDLDDAYAKLYESDVPSRHKGYYFGPLFGLIYPADVATRTPNSSSPEGFDRTSYDSGSGYLIGLQAGKDFGNIRLEGEYGYNSFDASGGLQASIHNFFSRLILEKELGDRFDLRGGLGMGLGFVNLEKGQEFKGVGFAYDFLLGVAYRVGENWGLQFDYRYFLTAANDEYDRIKNHAWILSASVDL